MTSTLLLFPLWIVDCFILLAVLTIATTSNLPSSTSKQNTRSGSHAPHSLKWPDAGTHAAFVARYVSVQSLRAFLPFISRCHPASNGISLRSPTSSKLYAYDHEKCQGGIPGSPHRHGYYYPRLGSLRVAFIRSSQNPCTIYL